MSKIKQSVLVRFFVCLFVLIFLRQNVSCGTNPGPLKTNKQKHKNIQKQTDRHFQKGHSSIFFLFVLFVFAISGDIYYKRPSPPRRRKTPGLVIKSWLFQLSVYLSVQKVSALMSFIEGGIAICVTARGGRKSLIQFGNTHLLDRCIRTANGIGVYRISHKQNSFKITSRGVQC